MTTNTLTTTQLQWLCALLEMECTHNQHKVILSERLNYPLPCPACLNTNRIPLLEGIREPCNNNQFGNPEPCLRGYVGWQKRRCPKCRGLGWTPTENVWTWLGEYRKLLGTFLPVTEHLFFDRFAEQLRPLAINAAEAEQWVRSNVQ